MDASASEQIEQAEQLKRELAAENPIAGGEPDQKFVEIEAKLEEMDAVIKEAQETRRAPDLGGDKTYGKNKGSESHPGARNERT